MPRRNKVAPSLRNTVERDDKEADERMYRLFNLWGLTTPKDVVITPSRTTRGG